MKTVTITLKLTMTDEDYASDDFKQFANQIRSGNFQREIMNTGNRNKFAFKKVTATIEAQ